MTHTRMNLPEAFPDHVEKIRDLKMNDGHFTRLSNEYHDVNRSIHRGRDDIGTNRTTTIWKICAKNACGWKE